MSQDQVLPKALVIHREKDLRLEEWRVATLQPDEVLIRPAWGGICGSDMHYFLHGGVGASVLKEPMILGHEVSGVIAALGSHISGFKVGQEVGIHPALPCGHCAECNKGLSRLCRNMQFFGSAAHFPHTNGGFRTAMTVKGSQVHALPKGLSLKHACLAEPLSVALHAISRAGNLKGKRILVQGVGPIGSLIVAGLTEHQAASVVATDLQDFPLNIASHLGATQTINTSKVTHQDEYDIVFEVTGVASALKEAIARTQKGGILVQVGIFPPGDVPAPIGQIIAREIDYRGTFRFDREFSEALRVLSEKPWIAEGLITHCFPLGKFQDAFDTALDRTTSSKVLLDLQDVVGG
ncbi:L-idonate 5-dehydrogenase [Swingsia samuiensis]|uniref:L-idonate 5-dehydrogenase n=1 Tax=Swingsia samuiensis TaxID=1293412 RepID=A0A4Y6UGH9_9PROT|nr:L-idonate 5-dehydrogenase [Swingsia samuiensis]QDH16669.1 L-idonate 5-dehydrogenase [Swingsia samuiensis]